VAPTATLPPAAVAAIAHDVLHVLAAAHALSITYGDMKPSNILLATPLGADSATVAARLADFGCASRASNLAGSGRHTPTTGTPLFLPPEALLLSKAGPSVDVYGLGAVLYLALTGRPPLPAPRRTPDGRWVQAAGGGARGALSSSSALTPADLLAAYLSDEEVALDGHPALEPGPAADPAGPAAFLASLLDRDWEARPSAAAALGHPWLAGVRAARAGPRADAAAARAAKAKC